MRVLLVSTCDLWFARAHPFPHRSVCCLTGILRAGTPAVLSRTTRLRTPTNGIISRKKFFNVATRYGSSTFSERALAADVRLMASSTAPLRGESWLSTPPGCDAVVADNDDKDCPLLDRLSEKCDPPECEGVPLCDVR